MVQQKLVSSEKTNEKEKICRDEPELRFKEFSDDWEVKHINQLCQVIGGGTPSTENEEYWNGNINWYTPSEIGQTKYVSTSERKITELGLKNSSAKLLPKDTILLSTRATIGECSITKTESSTNQGFQSLITNNKNNNEFIYYLIPQFKKEMIRKSSGSTFLEISKKEVEKIKVFVPSLNEQIKIGNFLSTIDKKIELLEKKLVLYQQLEAEWRKILFKDIELNSKFFTVDEIFKVISSKRFQIKNSEIKDKGKIPVLTQGKDKAGYFDNAAKLCNIFPIILFGDHTTHLQYINYPFIVAGDGIKLLQSRKENTNMKYLYYALKNYNISPEGYKRHYSILKEVELPIPSDFNQENIVLILNSLENKINLLKDFNKEFKLLKKGLLQKMFI